MSDPVISVVMPVFNAERFLTDAVESVLSQTFRDFELIAIDDGSTDRSLEILNGLSRRDARIRVISRPNKGISVTRNEGIEQARGEYIAATDADDVSMPIRFESQIRFLRNHPDHVAVGGQVVLTDTEGEPLRRWDLYEPTHDLIDAAHLVGRSGAISHPSCLFRREALRKVGGYSDRFEVAHDIDLFLRLAEVGKLGNVPETVMHYRLHPGSACNQKTRRMHDEIAEILAAARKARSMSMMPAPSQPPPVTPSRQEQAWAFWALSSGHVSTARKHALRSMRLAPFSRDSWRALLCSMRGR